MALVALVGLLPGTVVVVETLDVSLLEFIPIGPGAPLGGTRISLSRGTSEITAPTPPWVETSLTQAAAVAALSLSDAFGIPGSDFAAFPTMANPAILVAVEVHHVSCVEVIDAANSRISIRRPSSDLVSPPFVDVVGTAAAVTVAIAALTPTPSLPGVFGTGFVTGAGAGANAAAALAPCAGTNVAIVTPGTYLLIATGPLQTNDVLGGATASIRKNGAAFGQPLVVPAGGYFAPNVSQYDFAEQVVDLAIAGDQYDIAIASVPGGGAPIAIAPGMRLVAFRVA